MNQKKQMLVIKYNISLITLQALNFYNIFKKEISIDNGHDSPKKEKTKRRIKSVHSQRDRVFSQNSIKKISDFPNLNKNKKNPQIIFKNKNIIINDITKKYGNIKNEKFPEKKKVGVIYKLQTDYNTLNNHLKNKIEKINTETNKVNDNSYIKASSNIQKLNNKTDIKNKNNKAKDILKKVSKNLMKTSYNEKIKSFDNDNGKGIGSSNKGKNITQNRLKKIGHCGDSYEFNFTFNNYNSSFTYNSLNGNLIKDDNKKTDKIIFESLSNGNIINKFKSINSESVRDNILGGLKNILNKNKKDDKILKKSKDNQKTFVVRKKNKKKEIKYYATKIQAIFRGYHYRKNKKINKENDINLNIAKNNKYLNSNQNVYFKKKIINGRRSLIYNTNITDKNLICNSLKERSMVNMLNSNNNIGKTIENDNENKIQEIIIDKRKIYNVLNPTHKDNNTSENNIKKIKIKNKCSFRNRIGVKFKLSKCFDFWQNIVKKSKIIKKLIQYKKSQIINQNLNQNIYNNTNYNIRYQADKRKNGISSYTRGRFKNYNI